MAKSVADSFVQSLQAEHETTFPHPTNTVISVLDSNTSTFIARCGGGITVSSYGENSTSVTTRSADLHKLVNAVLKALK